MVAVTVLEFHDCRTHDRPRQLLRPLDRQYAALSQFLQPKLVDLARIIEAIEVDVNQRHASATVLLHQRERRAADVFGRDAKAFSEPANEGRLPCSQVANQQEG